jgi:TonB family protein
VARRLADDAATLTDDRLCRLQEEIAVTLGMSAPLARVLETDAVRVPVAFGLGEGCVLLPAGWREWDDEQLRAALAHEMAHLRRKDWAVRLWSLAARSVFWFHPLSWWLERRLSSLAEMCCDEEGARATGDPDRYAEIVLEFARAAAPMGGHFVLAGMAMARTGERKGLMHQRLERILLADRRGRGVLGKSTLAAIVLLALPVLWAASALQVSQAPPAPPATEPSMPPGMQSRLNQLSPAEEKGSNLSGADAERLEQTLEAEPGNDTARGELIADYYLNADAENWRRHVFWVIENRPESTLCVRRTFVVNPGENPFTTQADVERVGALWRDQVAAHLADAAVLVNAAVFQERSDARQALQWLLQAREADPGNRAVISEIVLLISNRLTIDPKVNSTGTPFETYALDVLENSRDAELLGLVGEADSNRLRAVRTLHSMRDSLVTTKESAEKHLNQALALDPANPRWQAALTRVQQFDVESALEDLTVTTEPAIASAPLQGVPPQRITVGAKVQQAMLTHQVAPVYPPLARQARIRGVVHFNILIDKDGSITNVKLVSGHPLFVQAALDAVRQWRYRPTLLNGQPVQVATQVDINFWTLPGERAQEAHQ